MPDNLDRAGVRAAPREVWKPRDWRDNAEERKVMKNKTKPIVKRQRFLRPGVKTLLCVGQEGKSLKTLPECMSDKRWSESGGS